MENEEKKTGRNQDGTFTAGTSGNPNGRPKGSSWKAAIQKIMDSDKVVLRTFNDGVMSETEVTAPQGQTIRDLTVAAAMTRAMKGDMNAIDFLADREEGKPKQSIEADITNREYKLIHPDEKDV